MGCCRAFINLTLCQVLNLAIFQSELQSSFLGCSWGKIQFYNKLLPLQIQPRITIHDFAQRQSSLNFTGHVSPFHYRVILASRYCHDTEELPPNLMMELLLIAVNVQRITIECNTEKSQSLTQKNLLWVQQTVMTSVNIWKSCKGLALQMVQIVAGLGTSFALCMMQ